MPPWQAGFALGELTHTRSVCVGVAETGGTNQCTQCVGWRRRDRGSLFFAALFVSKKREKRKEFLVFFKRHLIRQPVADTFSHWRRLAKMLAFVSALALSTPATLFQRACRQCVHESARLPRVICSHAWYSKHYGERKNYRFYLCPFAARTCHAWLARLTRARGRCFLRGRKALLNDFWYFSSRKSTKKEKFLYVSSLSEFFSLVRKERKGQKEECFDSRLGDADTHASHMCQSLF